jgi:crotonobetainyl-CoA:carnitine CoA-transferase CaiB-like acyl-CoA transferase
MRDKTGKGCLVDTSLFDSAVQWVEGQVNSYLVSGEVPKRHGTGGAVIVPYQTFDTADRPVCLAPGNDRLWARCAQVLGRSDWATDPRYAKSAARVANKAELLPMIAAAMLTKSRAEWLDVFEKAGVPCSPADLVYQLPAREGETTSPRVVGLPISFNRKRPRSARPAPKLGEHTDEVLEGRPAR